MDYNQYEKELKEEIRKEYPEASLEMHEVYKSNKVKTGISIQIPGEALAPTVYPEDFYRSGLTPQEALQSFKSFVLNTMDDTRISADSLAHENAASHVTLRVMNRAKNEELLRTCPHEVIGDLAVVPHWEYSKEASSVINYDLCKKLLYTPEEITSLGHKSVDKEGFHCEKLSEVMQKLGIGFGMDPSEVYVPDTPVHVLTNDDGINGSKCLLNDRFLSETYERLGEDYLILPSSTHEVLAVPYSAAVSISGSETDMSVFREMVSSVNATTVAEEDYLSDNIYIYRGASHSLSLYDSKVAMEEPTLANGLDHARSYHL